MSRQAEIELTQPRITTAYEVVTPALARVMLMRNTVNRPLRPGWIKTLTAAFERGEYVMSHQGIAFDTEGNLLDGQHRLHAIANQAEGFAVHICVTRGLVRKSTNAVIDIGARRSTSDSLGMSRDVVEVARIFVRLYCGQDKLTPTYIEPVALAIEETFRPLVMYCGSRARIWTAAPVRAAAVLRILGMPDQLTYVYHQYRALVLAEYQDMSASTMALYRAGTRGVVHSNDHVDLFARSWKVFDYRRAKLTKVQINDVSDVLNGARVVMARTIFNLLAEDNAQ